MVGDVCRAIDSLCEKYNAFPVLESTVGNFQTGANQLPLVYASVTEKYNYHSVTAQDERRQFRWFSAMKWTHPFAMRWKINYEKKTKSIEPLVLFPGAQVNPAGTSQMCCVCRRNPFTALQEVKHLEVRNGLIQTTMGAVSLRAKARLTHEQLRQARRQNKRLNLYRPLSDGPIKINVATSLLRDCLRTAPESLMSKDTMQSVYRCVFVDCQSVHHADEGAAINIGRKFMHDVLVRDQTPT